MRKLVYYVACSLDGFIAREDGAFDFALPEGEHLQDLMRRFPETFSGHLRGALGVTAPNQRFDTVLMGRATYEVALKLDAVHARGLLLPLHCLCPVQVDAENAARQIRTTPGSLACPTRDSEDCRPA